MELRAVRGMKDILPEQTARWQRLEQTFRELETEFSRVTDVLASDDADRHGYYDLVERFARAGERGIRVLLDLVAGHTSIEHPWFQVVDLTIGKRFELPNDVTIQVNGTIYNLLNADNSLNLVTQVLSATNTEEQFTEFGWTKPRRLQLQVGLQF